MRVCFGSMICEQRDPPCEQIFAEASPGNLVISISHAAPKDKLVVERADITDLIACLRHLGHLDELHQLREIAEWLRGDGRDAQRLALADGILERWGES